MYLSFYRLNKEPFHITPDPEFLYLSPSHKEALGSVIYGIEKRKGFIAITGEVGVGKTTILRSYLDRVDQRLLRIIYLFNSNVSFRGLLRSIFRELGIAPKTDDVYELVNQLHGFLVGEYAQGRNVVLIIDEAQNMPIATLENLRMLSNLETTKDKLIQILLVGQPEFDHKLNLNELRQLKQRIAIRCKILPLTRKESLTYIQHRLAKASRDNAAVFSNGALRLIIKNANGIPRTLNVLCDNALITGFGYQKKVISAKIVREIMADFEGHSRRNWLGLQRSASAGLFPSAFLSVFAFKRLFRTKGTPPRREDLDTSFDALDETSDPLGPGPLGRTDEGMLELPYDERRTPRETSPTDAWVADQSITLISEVVSDPMPGHDGTDLAGESDSDTFMKKNNCTYRFFTQGGNLTSLVIGVYGFCNDELLEKIRQENPRIKDFNRIRIGEIIRFPELAEDRE